MGRLTDRDSYSMRTARAEEEGRGVSSSRRCNRCRGKKEGFSFTRTRTPPRPYPIRAVQGILASPEALLQLVAAERRSLFRSSFNNGANNRNPMDEVADMRGFIATCRVSATCQLGFCGPDTRRVPEKPRISATSSRGPWQFAHWSVGDGSLRSKTRPIWLNEGRFSDPRSPSRGLGCS